MAGGEFSKETVGHFLKREREARRVSLEEISRSTRISRPYLEALERNDFRFFSRPEYIQGFLRGYARHIGLDPAEVLKRYEFQLELARLKENFHQLPLFRPFEAPSDEEQRTPQESLAPRPRKKKRGVPRSIYVQFIILLVALSISLYIYLSLKNLTPDGNSPGNGFFRAKESPKEEKPRKNGGPSPANYEKTKGSNQENKGENPVKTEKGTSGVDAALTRNERGKDSSNTPAGITKGRIFGNPESKIYYLPGMKNYDKAKNGKRVEFKSEEEAIQRGFHKATQ